MKNIKLQNIKVKSFVTTKKAELQQIRGGWDSGTTGPCTICPTERV